MRRTRETVSVALDRSHRAPTCTLVSNQRRGGLGVVMKLACEYRRVDEGAVRSLTEVGSHGMGRVAVMGERLVTLLTPHEAESLLVASGWPNVELQTPHGTFPVVFGTASV